MFRGGQTPFLYLCSPKLKIYTKMRKTYIKAELKVIPVKIETNLCAGTGNNSAGGTGTGGTEGGSNLFPAKSFSGTYEFVDSLQETKGE